MDLDKPYYAICDSVKIAELDSEKLVTLGQDSGLGILVKNSSLGITSDGFHAVRFFVENIEEDMAHGYLVNYEGGAVWKKINVDSLTERRHVKLGYLVKT